MNKSLVCAVVLLLTASQALASGYRIPEQSIHSTALAGAYGARPVGADASFFNPAGMAWLTPGWHGELSFTYINLPSIEYTDATTPARNSGSRTENFLLPNLHLVSPAVGRFRFGLSIAYPYGLSKRWDAAFPRSTAEDFTLKVYELNPTLSCRLTDWLALGLGARALRSTGEVKSFASNGAVTRDLDGDSTDYGYNLALSLTPFPNLALAATYRSKVNLEIEGNARLRYGAATYDGYAEVMVPAPAVLTLATAYTWGATTIELSFDKTYWSAYERLDFNYAYPLSGALGAAFDNPKPKRWVNTSAYRLGIRHRLNHRWLLMAGFAIDHAPMPDETMGFELPDATARIYSVGVTYQYNDRLQVGASYLYDDKESHRLDNGSINGTFDNMKAHLANLGLQYRF